MKPRGRKAQKADHDGKPITITVRTYGGTHNQILDDAEREELSVNAWVLDAIAEKLQRAQDAAKGASNE